MNGRADACATKDSPNVVHISPWDVLPRFGAVYTIGTSGHQVVRFAYGRYTGLCGRSTRFRRRACRTTSATEILGRT
jgi:hypothetical protein